MKGNCRHDPYVEQPPGRFRGSERYEHARLDHPTVIIQNDDDPHYWQGLESWQELQAYIDRLSACGREAWGKP